MKTDPELGKKIKDFLMKMNVETPFILQDHFYKKEEQIKLIRDSFKDIMQALNLDLINDSLEKTPERVAKMYIEEIFSGLDYNNFPKITTVANKMGTNEMICVKDICFQSACEHHFVTIDGFVKIAYIPVEGKAGKILGLSKINRIVQFFAKRPQIQERLGLQIYYCLYYLLNTRDIAVKIEATHFCVKARGVNDTHSKTTTSKLGGRFMQTEVRNEFLSL